MYIERNNLQVKLIRFRKKYWLYSRLLLRSEEFNAISPNERKFRQCIYCHWRQWVADTTCWSDLVEVVALLVIRLVHWCFFVDCGTGHNKHIVLLTKLRYADKCIVNEIVHRKEQLATIIHTMQYQMLTLFTCLLLRSDGFTHRRKFQTQTTSAPFLTA